MKLPNACPKPKKKVKSSVRRPIEKSKKRIPRRNAKNQKRLFERNFGGKAYRDYIVSLPCDVCGIENFSEPAHLDSRGSGGKADVLAPLCGMHYTVTRLEMGCHRRYDRYRWTLPEGTEERLKTLAAERWAEYTKAKEQVQ